MEIRKVAVLGAGVMGSQIAAHFLNAGFPVVLFEMASTGDDRYQHLNLAVSGLLKLKPAPLANNELIHLLELANYDDDMTKLSACDLIIEAIAENTAIKQALYKRISPYIATHAILASNTSGLSVNKLLETLPDKVLQSFCGIHFFNPPRYMKLVELVATDHTDAKVLDFLEAFIVGKLGKGVIRTKDTPNFIANRVGVFSMLSIIHHATRLHIPLEIVDQLTGQLMGRPKSGTFRLCDVVGLDTMQHVITTMTEHLTIDPWNGYYQTPEWFSHLIANKWLGQKSQKGIYYKEGQSFYVWDVEQAQYRLALQKAEASVIEILSMKDPQARMQACRASAQPQAQFVWACFRDLFHYCAVHAASIASSVRDIDLALRWGFGWQQGPFEIWQSVGFQTVLDWLQEDIAQKKTMVETELPGWVKSIPAFYQAATAYEPGKKQYAPRSPLPVYRRHYFPEAMVGETFDEGQTIEENRYFRLWHQGDGAAILSFKTKMNTIPMELLEGIQSILPKVAADYHGLVLWQRHGAHFSLGADLSQFLQTIEKGDYALLDKNIRTFQQTTQALRKAQIPVIAAVSGMVLGGGCEMVLHCDQIVAAFDSYMGLVEIGVGVVPAGGGCKELAYRAASQRNNGDVFAPLAQYYWQMAKAETASSAVDARQRRFLRDRDTIVFNAEQILFVAKQHLFALAPTYVAPIVSAIPVVGKSGYARLMATLLNFREGNFISDYDYELAAKLAYVVCGGEVEEGTLVSEQWLLDLEREAFLACVKQPLTQARIAHTLKTGKPLRN